MIQENKLIYNYENLVRGKPITADIFLTNYCNNKCVYCRYARTKEKRYMGLLDFKIYIDRLLSLGVKGLILTGGGEPTIHPYFIDIACWLEENKIPYGVNTNFNKIRYISPVFLKVSLDSYDRESYKRVRGVDTYNDVIQNIKDYILWNNTMMGGKTTVIVQSLVVNPDDVIKFYDSVKGLGVDFISFRPMEYVTNEVRDEQECVKILEGLKAKDKRVLINYKWGYLNDKPSGCPANFTNLAINEKGEVLYCCHHENAIVGHILDDDILEKKKNYKIDFSSCETPCRLTGANNTYKKIMSEKPVNDYMFI